MGVPTDWLEMATGAEMVSSKILYALGYFVLENYIVYLERDQLVLADGAESVTSSGGRRDIIKEDIDNFLLDAARDSERGYRAIATRIPGSNSRARDNPSGLLSMPSTSNPLRRRKIIQRPAPHPASRIRAFLGSFSRYTPRVVSCSHSRRCSSISSSRQYSPR